MVKSWGFIQALEVTPPNVIFFYINIDEDLKQALRLWGGQDLQAFSKTTFNLAYAKEQITETFRNTHHCIRHARVHLVKLLPV